MKKGWMILLAIVLLCAACATAGASETTSGSDSITVTGNATLTLAADMAQLQIGAEIRGATVEKAQEECNRIIAEVVKSIKANGIADKDIMTSYFNINTWNDFDKLDANGQATVTYSVSSMLDITVRDLSVIGKLIDDATKAGANSSYGMTFLSSQSSDAYLKALGRAVEDAKSKADVLAAAAGLMVGDIRSIDASGYDYAYGITDNMDARSAVAEGMTIISGDVSVTASVKIVYGIIR